MGIRNVVAGLFLAACALAPAAAEANWTIGHLTNSTTEPVTVVVPFGPGTTANAASILGVRGNLTVIVLGVGAVVFTDQGHNTPCSRPYWGVKVEYGDRSWGFFYDGEGVVNMTVNADGSVAFAPGSGGSQVVVGNGPPQCSVR